MWRARCELGRAVAVLFVFRILCALNVPERSAAEPILGSKHGACAEMQAEHPVLTNARASIAVCGSTFSPDRVHSACSVGWHLCSENEFFDHYPEGANPRGAMSSFGVKQEARCDSCVRAGFLAWWPAHPSPACANLWRNESFWNESVGFLPDHPQPAATPLVQGQAIVSATGSDTLFAPPGAWVASWGPIPGSERHFAVYCCAANSSMRGAPACSKLEAEHPSYTTPLRDAALCGGTFTIEQFSGACAPGWAVCTLPEWEARYNYSEWPGGLKSSWGASQDVRGWACPVVSGRMWEAEIPQRPDYFCGNVCRTADLVDGKGVLLLRQNQSLWVFPRFQVQSRWFVRSDLRPVSMHDVYSVLCCTDSFPPPHPNAGHKVLPMWSVWLVGGASGALYLFIAVMAVWTWIASRSLKRKLKRKELKESHKLNVDDIDDDGVLPSDDGTGWDAAVSDRSSDVNGYAG